LPSDLARLSQIQAVTITTSTWEIVMDQLIRTIRPMLRMTGTDAQHKVEDRTRQPVVEVETVAT
jgi:hypothetical protein